MDKLNILCVEDNPGDRRLIKEIFSQEPLLLHDVHFVVNLKEAIQEVSETPYQCVLLDLGLPDSLGLDTLEKLKPHTKEIAIIVLSGMQDERLFEQILQLGATEYIYKGILDSNILSYVLRHARDREQYKKKVVESNKQILSLIDRNADGIIVMNKDGLLRYANPTAERLLERTNEKLTNLPFELPSQSASNREINISSVKGEQITVEIRISEIIFNEEACLLASMRDISERKKYEEELRLKNKKIEFQNNRYKALNKELTESKQKAEESDMLKSAFLSNMNHEIRTPMNSIIGFAKLLRKDNYSHKDKEMYFRIIEENCTLLMQIIDDMLDLAKIESGSIDLVERNGNVNEMIADLEKEFNLRKIDYEKQNLKIISSTPGIEGLMVSIDFNRLKQVLTNLITNSIKYTDIGTVEIGYTLPNEDEIEFFVKDTGQGIPEEELEHIFKRFYRAENTSYFVRGTGLGLAIVESIVMLMGGKINVESTLNKGSCFYIRLPLKIHKKEEPVKKRNIHYDFNDKKILVADDDEGNLFLTRILLEDLGANVITARNGKQAIEACCADNDIDFVIMDIKMPELDGIEACKIIRSKGIQIPIIMHSAYASDDVIDKVVGAGANGFFQKPIDELDIGKIVF